MPINFPTNLVGNLDEWKLLKYENRGFWGDNHHFHEYFDFVRQQWTSKKPLMTHGDTFHATNYEREVTRVLIDKPITVCIDGRDGNGSFHYERTHFVDNWDNSSRPSKPPKWQDIANNDSARCQVEALNKLREGKVQNGADIGEARKTAQMIAKPMIDVLNAFKAAKHGNWGVAGKHLGLTKHGLLTGKTASEKWLEYQYGWKPLLGSIHANVALLERQISEPSATFTVQKSRTVKYVDEYEDGYTNRKWFCTGRCRTGFTYKITDDFIAGLDTAGVLNPLSIAWELTPFSFVLDWFIPVGNVLSALSATLGLELLTGYISHTQEIHYKAKQYNRPYEPVGSYVTDDGQLEKVLFEFNRKALTSFPIPQLYSNRNPFSTLHVANATALLRQLLK